MRLSYTHDLDTGDVIFYLSHEQRAGKRLQANYILTGDELSRLRWTIDVPGRVAAFLTAAPELSVHEGLVTTWVSDCIAIHRRRQKL